MAFVVVFHALVIIVVTLVVFFVAFFGLIVLFGPHCLQGLNTLKFHLLDNMVDVLDRFETILVLFAFLYKQFNLIFKRSYA